MEPSNINRAVELKENLDKVEKLLSNLKSRKPDKVEELNYLFHSRDSINEILSLIDNEVSESIIDSINTALNDRRKLIINEIKSL